ncbi:hypothetical protein [Celeribacter halophilus]|uniref:hypothetical protein n=1 Tax=Celeribacter halophilus TaxID=576117 RepID=UPI001C08F790|nr:hypothetical protein [Celeribacter halophilus]MBU2888291.1 hypothetical protein [Celeribacter halophilus]MDO6512034.1 hypothetical protein [Celeribacter halophilus]
MVGFAAFGGIVPFALVTLLVLFFLTTSPFAALVFFFFAMLFQSAIISLFSPFYPSRAVMNAAQGITFGAISAFSTYGFFFIYKLPRDKDLLTGWLHKWVIILLGVAVFYFLIGAIQASPLNATIYLRALVAVPLQIIFGYYITMKLGIGKVFLVLKIFTFCAIIYGLFEVLFPASLYSLLNTETYFSYKLENRWEISSVNDLIELGTRPLFNLAIFEDLGITFLRISGPNLHSISYAYFLGIMSIFLFVRKHYVWGILALCLLAAIQAKGIIIVLLMSAFLTIVRHFLGRTTWRYTAFALLTAYVVTTITYGIRVFDYHILGLIGGINGFAHNPIGHGLGAGGNLARETIDWNNLTFGLESAIGVMLYQIGICTFVFVAFFLKFQQKVLIKIENAHLNRFRIFPIMFFVIVFNGFFQEEAYNFFALGLAGFLCAVLAAHTEQQTILQHMTKATATNDQKW